MKKSVKVIVLLLAVIVVSVILWYGLPIISQSSYTRAHWETPLAMNPLELILIPKWAIPLVGAMEVV
jgi:energy-converting hydrogenase Eha subunit A